jgi:hypothetical protein
MDKYKEIANGKARRVKRKRGGIALKITAITMIRKGEKMNKKEKKFIHFLLFKTTANVFLWINLSGSKSRIA